MATHLAIAARGLNGFQKERAVANVSVTYLFTHN